jgi:hypothetical protein
MEAPSDSEVLCGFGDGTRSPKPIGQNMFLWGKEMRMF